MLQASLQSSGFSHAYDSLRRDAYNRLPGSESQIDSSTSASLAALHANNNNQVGY